MAATFQKFSHTHVKPFLFQIDFFVFEKQRKTPLVLHCGLLYTHYQQLLLRII